MIQKIKRIHYVGAYYLSWFFFGVVGLALNITSVFMLPLPHRAARQAGVRLAIRGSFELWLKWFHASGLIRVRWHGFDEPLKAGTVYVANHPMLLDATFLLARLPDAVCIFKPSLMRNPAIGPAAIMAGYVSGDAGVELIREAAAKVGSGCSLLIFPEGTRTTPGELPRAFKPGFALIASHAQAPVQLIIIRATPGMTAKGKPWWHPPAILPTLVDIYLDQCWEHVPGRYAADLTKEVERRVSEVLQPSAA